MRHALPILALLALTGCGSDPAAPEPDSTTPAAPAGELPAPASSAIAAPQLPAPASLAGEWRVAGIDGQAFNEPYGLGLSASDREIWWAPRCAGAVRGYAITGNSVRFVQAASRGPEPLCAAAPPPKLADVLRALDSADTIVITPSNGIEVSGGGHSVVLFSQ